MVTLLFNLSFSITQNDYFLQHIYSLNIAILFETTSPFDIGFLIDYKRLWHLTFSR